MKIYRMTSRKKVKMIEELEETREKMEIMHERKHECKFATNAIYEEFTEFFNEYKQIIELSSGNQEMEDNINKLTGIENSLSKLSSDLDKAKANAESLKKSEDELKKKIEKAKDKEKDELQATLKSTTAKRESANKKVKNKSAKIDKLKAQKKELDALKLDVEELGTIKSEKAGIMETLNQKHDEFKEWETEIGQQYKMYKVLFNVINVLEATGIDVEYVPEENNFKLHKEDADAKVKNEFLAEIHDIEKALENFQNYDVKVTNEGEEKGHNLYAIENVKEIKHHRRMLELQVKDSEYFYEKYKMIPNILQFLVPAISVLDKGAAHVSCKVYDIRQVLGRKKGKVKVKEDDEIVTRIVRELVEDSKINGNGYLKLEVLEELSQKYSECKEEERKEKMKRELRPWVKKWYNTNRNLIKNQMASNDNDFSKCVDWAVWKIMSDMMVSHVTLNDLAMEQHTNKALAEENKNKNKRFKDKIRRSNKGEVTQKESQRMEATRVALVLNTVKQLSSEEKTEIENYIKENLGEYYELTGEAERRRYSKRSI